jgi:hypothetical protein
MALAAHAAPVAAPFGARPRAWQRISLGGLAVLALALALTLALTWSGSSAAAAPAPAFDDAALHVSHDGSVQLSWPGTLGDYEVLLHHGEHTRVAYRGRVPAAHLSGLLEGDYTVRLRAHDGDAWSAWSEAKPLQVRHHSRPLVAALMSLGFLTFATTAAVVLRASRRAA